MSRIIGFDAYGGPEVLKFKDVEIPAPRADEIRIRVKAIGLNRAESMWRTGVYVEPVNLPGRLGYEASGVVESIGSGVTNLVPGDEVTTLPSFSMNDYAVYGELVLVPAHSAVKKLASLSFAEAAAIWNTFVTPYGAFVEANPLTSNDVVIISAASSGVGMGAIQVARMMGATVIALTRTAAKRQHLIDAGATHVIVTDEQDIADEVARITDAKGASVVFDPVGGPNFPKLIEAMAPGATLYVYGALSDEVTPLPMLALVAKEVVVRGYNLFSITSTPERQAAVVAFVNDGIASGQLKVTVADTFAFDDIVEAHRALERNVHIGKIVVEV